MTPQEKELIDKLNELLRRAFELGYNSSAFGIPKETALKAHELVIDIMLSRVLVKKTAGE